MGASPHHPTTEVVLKARGLRKEFRGYVAVSGVDLDIHRGEIHALIGPNGAGKTTVFNLLTKFLLPTSGQILLEGIDVSDKTPAALARRGLKVVARARGVLTRARRFDGERSVRSPTTDQEQR